MTAAGSMPYSSCRMPRIQTGAVIWYSGTPMRLPIRSLGSLMPLLADTKTQECRKNRDGNTGMAMKAGSSRCSDTVYDDSDNSAASNSRKRSMRKKVSSTGRLT